MARSKSLTFAAAALLSLTVSVAPVFAQSAQSSSTWSQEDTVRIIKDVQQKIGGLTNYAVFDWITFGIHGKTLVLNGYASRPTLKDEAGRVVKGIPGIDSVENQIEVLPNSPNDDRVRAAVYNRIYSAPSLSKYNANAGRMGRGSSIARMAGGITADPPLGYHAIHIIVKNGNVTLYGVVLNQSDAAIAGMQANSAPGSFSITNNLVVQGAPPKAKAK
ncbi:MAG: BON domain-containing protein [Edaphobacter sp.]